MPVGDVVHVSGCTLVDPTATVRSPGDWAAQFDICHEGIEEVLGVAGARLDDVIRRRKFTIAYAEQNRPYGEGPAWFKDSGLVSMSCGIDLLAEPVMLVEVDAVAIKGTGDRIEWPSLQGIRRDAIGSAWPGLTTSVCWPGPFISVPANHV